MRLISALALISYCLAPVQSEYLPGTVTLILNNDTDATLQLRRVSGGSGLASPEISLSGPSTITIGSYLASGRNEIRISARLVSPTIAPIVKVVWVSGPGPYEVRVTASDFGKSLIFDVPGAGGGEPPSPYATEVVSFRPGTPNSYGPKENARYKEDWEGLVAGTSVDQQGFVSLGCGGSITLGFNLDTMVSGVKVHEVGPLVEATLVEVRVRTEGRWMNLGEVAGSVNQKTLSPAQHVIQVRLTDQRSACNGVTQGADIDAVELIR